jgi:hypothetical protein
MEDVSQRSVQLPDVVKQRHALDTAQSVLVETRGLPEYQRVRRNTTHVLPGLFVVGADCIEKRLHRRGSESLRFGSPRMLAVEESAGGEGY